MCDFIYICSDGQYVSMSWIGIALAFAVLAALLTTIAISKDLATAVVVAFVSGVIWFLLAYLAFTYPAAVAVLVLIAVGLGLFSLYEGRK